MRCNICGGENTKLIYKGYPGYVDNDVYDVYECKICDGHFVFPNKVDQKFYDIIYSEKNPEKGYYAPLYEEANKIKLQRNPLGFLLNSVHNYYAVVKYLKNEKNLEILEIGCGYGYLVWTLNKMGHKAFGIDVSDNAIKFAKENFGNTFMKADINQFTQSNPEKRYDLIIGIEVVEHVPDVTDFIRKCFSLLKPGGKIIITTPNKDYFKKNSVWPSDLPPVHLSLLGIKTFKYIAGANNLDVIFIDFSEHVYSSNERLNKLVNRIMSRRKEGLPSPVLNSSGVPNLNRSTSPPFIKRILKYLLVEFKPLRFCSNLIYSLIFKGPRYDSTLGVIMWRK